MKILVTTGCSYTHYRYYTWADYLSKGYDKFFNLGMAGSSIKFSYIKVLDYIRANKDTLNNTDIYIQWTSLKRHYLIIFVIIALGMKETVKKSNMNSF